MKKRLFCIILALIMVLTAIIFRISRYYSISCDIYSETGVKGLISNEINTYISQKLNNISHNATEIKYLPDGNISEIKADMIFINQFASETAVEIYNLIINNTAEFGIPFGNTLGVDYLSGIGPKIKVRIIPIGAVNYKISSQLLESSINQTLHRISIDFKITIECLAPFHKNLINIDSSVIIAETLIVGKVPDILFPSG